MGLSIAKGSGYKGLNIEKYLSFHQFLLSPYEGRKGKTPPRDPSLSKDVDALLREPFLPQRPLLFSHSEIQKIREYSRYLLHEYEWKKQTRG